MERDAGQPDRQARSSTSRARRRAIAAYLGLVCLYASAIAAVAWANGAGPERWWWSTLNLYLPQWLWALPAAFLLLVGLAAFRNHAWLPALLLVWVLGPE